MPSENNVNLNQVQLDIVTVVSSYLTLQNSHRALKGVCPFHDDQGLSLRISPQNNIFRCFGCGKDGGPIEFVMEIEKKSYQEALSILSTRLNVQ
ncbi:CHC2 zinc finger domain-containing protein [Mucilaginibacter polytrichastri]|uniref:CHC2 zinc finger domain-containing protein n=1 Tax=Mucilaginibacter polytrichastri TaxID=1302689 RepID=UPI0008DEF972|nr:CHC2 zinc finger domain-containing protein [Mucilaginibacter polytrichastri]SFT22729.1 CHC2 zinc finger [Mucilaginibacter polytrichastri]